MCVRTYIHTYIQAAADDQMAASSREHDKEIEALKKEMEVSV